MTKKKGIASKLFLLVVLLTLISCCFLGSTFARYISTESGNATMQVAKWDISTGEDDMKIEFGKLSPAKEEYVSTPRTHSTGKTVVATITNNGEVDALVTLTLGAKTISCSAGYGTQGVATDGNPTKAEVKEVFTVKLYYTVEDGSEQTLTAGDAEVKAEDLALPAGKTISISAEVIWTSDTATITGDTADVRDTWIGKHVTGVSATLAYTAVQNSEKP